MRLSEAIILGDALKKCNGSTFIPDPRGCCAIGGALLAIGVSSKDFYRDISACRAAGAECGTTAAIIKRWPWLTEGDITEISHLYFRVEEHTKTIEQLVDYVRSIEPSEPSAETPEIDYRDESGETDCRAEIERFQNQGVSK